MGAPVGNQNGRKAKVWEQAVKRALARLSNQTVDRGLDLLADQLVKAAAEGQQWALIEVGSRMDGKPAQSIEHTGDLTYRHTTELSDDVLAHIATGSSEGASEATSGTEEPSPVH